jgi:hypothetical protein
MDTAGLRRRAILQGVRDSCRPGHRPLLELMNQRLRSAQRNMAAEGSPILSERTGRQCLPQCTTTNGQRPGGKPTRHTGRDDPGRDSADVVSAMTAQNNARRQAKDCSVKLIPNRSPGVSTCR